MSARVTAVRRLRPAAPARAWRQACDDVMAAYLAHELRSMVLPLFRAPTPNEMVFFEQILSKRREVYSATIGQDLPRAHEIFDEDGAGRGCGKGCICRHIALMEAASENAFGHAPPGYTIEQIIERSVALLQGYLACRN